MVPNVTNPDVWLANLVSICSQTYPQYIYANFVVPEWPSLDLHVVKDMWTLFYIRVFVMTIAVLQRFLYSKYDTVKQNTVKQKRMTLMVYLFIQDSFVKKQTKNKDCKIYKRRFFLNYTKWLDYFRCLGYILGLYNNTITIFRFNYYSFQFMYRLQTFQKSNGVTKNKLSKKIGACQMYIITF